MIYAVSHVNHGKRFVWFFFVIIFIHACGSVLRLAVLRAAGAPSAIKSIEDYCTKSDTL